MLICGKCNTQNQLGRVFCSSCGAKLDLSNMGSEAIGAFQKKSTLARFWWIAPAVLGVIILVNLVLALWPASRLIGAEGTRVGGRRVEQQLQAMLQAAPGQAILQEYTEKDINGYFQFFKDGKVGFDSVRVSVQPNAVVVRTSSTLFKIPLGKKPLAMRLTYTVNAVPAGNQMHLVSASIGHLPALGPLRTMVFRKLYGNLSAQREWKGMANLGDIKAEAGKLKVLVNKR